MVLRLAALGGPFLAALLSQAVLVPAAQAQQPAAKPPAASPKPTVKPGAAPPPAAAPEPDLSAAHLALAREVMLSSGIARSFDSIIPTMAEQIRKNAVTRPDLAKDLDEVLKGLDSEMELQKQRLINIAARIYAKRLNEAELTDIVTFFRSPAGKRYVETQPQILDDMVGAMQDWTQEVSEYIMVRTRAEMGKRGHQLQ
ncbi:DUF2059 domain-containing protein [Methylorubrum extorquens]|uniref:DUF2059 domain-containing protein n=1 Tax=Methylorubrum extorquens TaxID=408 RepID=UPI000158F21D|nr:DUF2059 domain-containing protein [Methylorubrum extorquens]KQP87440.1 hypothetical protein ASF55_06275 [Methylobacterium sp. Leaf119]ABY30694.1 conserved hypothetical protein [Methylorubrum extorquens PA1]UYW28727.1 DUF2059 domain-containing protein [Methylorubrum extorquens]UYW31560.1 DUF2059 domain-containing protein [Methylorubrum extorquens]WIU41964.1 DUF2059 domain-containing protein [Methylorubrum extorquens]